MRARSVHLVTSWWVVGVWAALGICTGVISVVTVLQPSWYVRYTFIHAQEARGLSFQVAVSSLGPLGYCRLSSVDTSDITNTPATFKVHHAFDITNFTLPPIFSTSSTPANYDLSWIFETFSSTKTSSTTPSILDTDVAKTFSEAPLSRTYHSTVSFAFSAVDFTPSRSDPSFEGAAHQDEEEENDTRYIKKEKEREDNYAFDGENVRLERNKTKTKLTGVLPATTEITTPAKKGTHATNVQGNIKEKEKDFIEGANKTEVVERGRSAEDSMRDGNNVIVYLRPMDVILKVTRDFVRSGKDAHPTADKVTGVSQEPQPEETSPKQETFFTQERNSNSKPLGDKSGQKVDNWKSVDVNATRRVNTTKGQLRNTGATRSRRRRRKHKKGRRTEVRRYQEIRREKEKMLQMSKFTRNKTRGPSHTHIFLPIFLRTTEIPAQPSLLSAVISDPPKLHSRRVHRKGRDQKFRSAQLQSPKMTNRSSETDIHTPGKERRVGNDKKYDKIPEIPQRKLAEEKPVPRVKGRDEHRIIAEFLRQQEEQLALPLFVRAAGFQYQPRQPVLHCSGVGIGVGSGTSSVWVLVGVLYGAAGLVQVAAGVSSLATQVVRSSVRRFAFAIWVSNVQVAVVMTQGVMLVLFPLGLGSPLARGECGGSSSVYWPGDCSFGWAYMLAVVATTLAAYCPCLARLTAFRKHALGEWKSLNFF